MSIALVTGSSGLIGSEASRRFHAEGFGVVGVDDDMRARFFGAEASTAPLAPVWSGPSRTTGTRTWTSATWTGWTPCSPAWARQSRQRQRNPEPPGSHEAPLPGGGLPLHEHQQGLRRHAQPPPSRGASHGLGDRSRPRLCAGIGETMSIDQTKHSLLGASKVAAVVLVQEYGRFFGMKTVCFRGGCLTGPGHGVVAVLPGALNRRGVQPLRQPALARLDAGIHRPLRGDRRPEARLDLRRGQPDRRPRLMGQRRAKVPVALPGLAVPTRAGPGW